MRQGCAYIEVVEIMAHLCSNCMCLSAYIHIYVVQSIRTYPYECYILQSNLCVCVKNIPEIVFFMELHYVSNTNYQFAHVFLPFR